MGFSEDNPPVVGEVTENGPAAKAGIKEGDIVLRVGDTPVKNVRSTVEAIRLLKPGDQVNVTVRRKDKEMEIRLVVGKRPAIKKPSWKPEVTVRAEDYRQVRQQFRTKLVRQGPSPQKTPMPNAPSGVTVVEFDSGALRLKGWINRPEREAPKRPAIVFLHGGFGFGEDDWKMTQAYRDAGYVVLTPILRGENGQPGMFTLFYDEVDDALAAADYLAKQPYVDNSRLFVAGHSVGGILAMLSAEASPRFHAAASFSGSPDQVLYCRYGFPKKEIPFDVADPREFEVRSPLAYAGSFKCPVRLFYGTDEKHLDETSKRTAAIAKEKGIDCEAIPVEGGHETAVPAAMKKSIAFFESK
jgi:dienelactone hydrolase